MFQSIRGTAAMVLAIFALGLGGCVSDEDHQQVLTAKTIAENRAHQADIAKTAAETRWAEALKQNKELSDKLALAQEKIGRLDHSRANALEKAKLANAKANGATMAAKAAVDRAAGRIKPVAANNIKKSS